MKKITLHTDGSCETQTQVGGWAAVLRCGDYRRVLQGSACDTTVNAMELTAVIEGLAALKQSHQTVEVFADSNYVVKGVNEWLTDWKAHGWRSAKGKAIANLSLWQRLDALIGQHTITFTWLPREANGEADGLAQGSRMAHGQTATEPEPQPVPAPPPTLHIMVAGSRYATGEMVAYARRVVQRAHQLGHIVVVGDNPQGVDMAVVQECRRLKAKVVVVGIANFPRNGGCRHGQYIKVERDLYRASGGNLLDKYTVRDRYMVDMCRLGMFIWNGDSRGTKAGYDYAISRGKQAHLVNFSREVIP
jgi:ribonuclease HI